MDPAAVFRTLLLSSREDGIAVWPYIHFQERVKDSKNLFFDCETRCKFSTAPLSTVGFQRPSVSVSFPVLAARGAPPSHERPTRQDALPSTPTRSCGPETQTAAGGGAPPGGGSGGGGCRRRRGRRGGRGRRGCAGGRRAGCGRGPAAPAGGSSPPGSPAPPSGSCRCTAAPAPAPPRPHVTAPVAGARSACSRPAPARRRSCNPNTPT